RPAGGGAGGGWGDDAFVAGRRAGVLAVIGGGVARCRFVMGPRLAVAAERLGGAPLPVAGAGERDRIAVADGDLGEMPERGCRITEEAQRDPTGGELLLGAVILLARGGGIARDAIGGPVVPEVEKLARHQPPLDPPLVG